MTDIVLQGRIFIKGESERRKRRSGDDRRIDAGSRINPGSSRYATVHNEVHPLNPFGGPPPDLRQSAKRSVHRYIARIFLKTVQMEYSAPLPGPRPQGLCPSCALPTDFADTEEIPAHREKVPDAVQSDRVQTR
jgi:hypothetical protein